MLEKNIDQVLLANKLCIFSVNVKILVGSEIETNLGSIVESITVCNRAKWVRLDVEWPRIALCDDNWNILSKKFRKNGHFSKLLKKKTIFCQNYWTK